MNNLTQALGLKEDGSPFPWQEEMLARFLAGIGNRLSLDIPTGLGKTGVISAWLVAKSDGVSLPRRLVYVVDRRAVVDQATREAVRLRAWVDANPDVKLKLGLHSARSLPISTLRGQYVDNREWLDDPSTPAIIVGTVDMVGSRLLFEGYGVSRKMRPYHAALLGSDTLFVLDEAHLVPPFEMLLENLVLNIDSFGPDGELAGLVPDVKLLSLSATGRTVKGEVLRLGDKDLKHPEASKRLEATKKLTFCESDGSQPLAEMLAAEAWKLAGQGRANVRVIVFSNSRDDAEKALSAVVKRAKGNKNQGIEKVVIETQLFVGARRVRERDKAADWLAKHGFLAGRVEAPERPAFVFATSAGEVGVDLDADHMVSDLVEWERMIQRLGRVNRRGNGEANVRVIVESPQPDKKTQEAMHKSESDRTKEEQKKVADFAKKKQRPDVLRQPIQSLPKSNGEHNASPGAIRHLKIQSEKDTRLAEIFDDATSPAPLRPALTRPVVDAWSMTSLEKHTGRPLVAPWLRGWIDEEPQTMVVWRRYLPVCDRTHVIEEKRKTDAREFFEHAPPHLSETLDTESYRVLDWLTKRANAILKAIPDAKQSKSVESADGKQALQPDSVIAIILGRALEVLTILTLRELVFDSDDKTFNKRNKDNLQRNLNNNTLIVDRRFGGLSEEGLLNISAKTMPGAADEPAQWIEVGESEGSAQAPIPEFRVRESEDGARSNDADWQTCFRFASRVSDEGEPTSFLVVDKWKHNSSSEDSRSVSRTHQQLAVHRKCAEYEAERLASRLSLSGDHAKMLRIAARLHDEGKNCDRWQNAFSAKPEGRPYAKTIGPVKLSLLDGYRHEFGSLANIEADSEFQELNPDLQELCLHLVAAHHGFARPVIRTHGCEDSPPSALEERARDVALRFARLQQRWGPWGLAWWESLLRAADQRASRAAETQEQENSNG